MLESRQAFKVAAARFFGLANRVFSRQTGFFFECKLLFKDKPMVITEPTIPSARGLGSKLYPSNMPRMLNKDLSRFKERFCWQGAIDRSLSFQSPSEATSPCS